MEVARGLSFLPPTPQFHINMRGGGRGCRNHELNVVTTRRHEEIRLICGFNYTPCPSLNMWCFIQFN